MVERERWGGAPCTAARVLTEAGQIFIDLNKALFPGSFMLTHISLT